MAYALSADAYTRIVLSSVDTGALVGSAPQKNLQALPS